MNRSKILEHDRASAGFTLVELLVVVTILAILAIIAVPQLFKTREKGARREGMAQVENIVGAMERRFADGNFSYTTGGSGSAGVCPGTSSAFTSGATIFDLNLAITGSFYNYTITVSDTNADSLCDAFTVTATGIAAPVTGQTLTLNQTGVKTGNWN